MDRYDFLRELPNMLIALGHYSLRDETKISIQIEEWIKKVGSDVIIAKREPTIPLNGKDVESFSRYRDRVDELTRRQPIHLLPNYEKRAFYNWHLDHKIPVFFGWTNQIPPELIAHLGNLEMIPAKKNLQKSRSYINVKKFKS